MKQHKTIQNNIPTKVLNLLKEISQNFSVSEIIIYGSRARGDHHERSDIDIAINGPNLKDCEWLELEDKIKNNELSLLKIDLVRLDSIKDKKFKDRILSEGVSI